MLVLRTSGLLPCTLLLIAGTCTVLCTTFSFLLPVLSVELGEVKNHPFVKMRGTTSKHSNQKSTQKPFNEELHLSGSFIRSLVRQLSSSRSKEIMTTNLQDEKVGHPSSQNLAKFSTVPEELHQQKSDLRPLSQSKKQIRRRSHTSKSYQERVINMAEARREIVSALKLHRAAMRSSEQSHKQETSLSTQEVPSFPSQMHSEESMGRQVISSRDTGIYSPISAGRSCFNSAYFHSSPRASNFHQTDNSGAVRFANHSGSFISKSPPQMQNLNLYDLNYTSSPFVNIDDSSLPHLYMLPNQWTEIPQASYDSGLTMKNSKEIALDNLHPIMNEEEIAKIRLIGEQHDMEWNDQMNLSASAWWFSILKNMERDYQEKDGTEGIVEDIGMLTDIAPWINGQQAMNGSSSEARKGDGVGFLMRC